MKRLLASFIAEAVSDWYRHGEEKMKKVTIEFVDQEAEGFDINIMPEESEANNDQRNI